MYENGQRTEAKTTEYIWYGDKVQYEEVTQSRAVSATVNLWGATGLAARNNTVYSSDAHGNTDESYGTTTTRYLYDAYGNQLNADAGDENPYRYCGEHYDEETGLYYLRARYYDPELGRFLTEDPAQDGGNWYVYCGNNPVNRWDPSGQSWLDDLWAYLTRAAADVADFWYPTVYAPGTELAMPSPNDVPSNITTVSAYGIAFIRKYESLSLTSYETYPGNGDWTIGWGHKIPTGQLGNFSGGITKEQAEHIFNEDLYMILNTTFLPFLEKYHIELTQNQFDAMASFTFNLG